MIASRLPPRVRRPDQLVTGVDRAEQAFQHRAAACRANGVQPCPCAEHQHEHLMPPAPPPGNLTTEPQPEEGNQP